MTFQPLVSIVIPVYNGANYLHEAIESALAQTYQYIEVLVVNDGSTDDGATEQVALSFGERIRYFRKENGGVASALNCGIQEMRGDYFSWLSHDDVYYPHKVETQVTFLKDRDDKEIVLYSDFDIIDEKSSHKRTIVSGKFRPDQFCIALVLSCPLHGCDALVPRSCFINSGLFDESLVTTNDYDMWFRFALKYNFYHLPHSLIKGRVHAESDSVTKKRLALKEIDSSNLIMLDKLPPGMVLSYSGGHIGLFYLDCAFSFAFRQTCNSCYTAIKKSFKYIYSDNIIHIVKHHILLCYLCVKLIFVMYILLSYRLKQFSV